MATVKIVTEVDEDVIRAIVRSYVHDMVHEEVGKSHVVYQVVRREVMKLLEAQQYRLRDAVERAVAGVEEEIRDEGSNRR